MNDMIKILPSVALRWTVILPETIVHFDISREKSIKAIEAAMIRDQKIFLVAQKNPDIWINPNVEMYSNSLFGDIDHLNTEGATMYSNIIKERYPQIFVH